MVKKSISSHTKYLGVFIAVIGLIQICLYVVTFIFTKDLGVGIIDSITKIIFFITWIGLFIFGVGVQRFTSWAPKLLLWLAIIAIPNNVIKVINTLIMNLERFRITWLIGAFIELLPAMFYIFLIYFFTRPKVKEQFYSTNRK